jgi:hypothetical protein
MPRSRPTFGLTRLARVGLLRLSLWNAIIVGATLSAPASAAHVDVTPPVLFEQNVGQASPDVLVQSRVQDLKVTVRRDALAVSSGFDTLTLRFVGGGAHEPRFDGEARDKLRWVRADGSVHTLPAFESATFGSTWPGIDVVMTGRDGQVAFDLEMAPHADVRAARFLVDSAAGQQLVVSANGDLVVHGMAGTFSLSRPVAYQERDGVRVPVDAHFDIDASTVGFALGSYDARLPVVIDPTFRYGSYVPGFTNNIVVGGDATHAYVARAASNAGPAVEDDLYVAKIDPSETGLDSLVWGTYLEGTNGTAVNSGVYPVDADVDENGRFLICGSQNNAFVSSDLMNVSGIPEIGYQIALVVGADGVSLDYVVASYSIDARGCAFEPNTSRFFITGRVDASPLLKDPLPGQGGRSYLGWFDTVHDPDIDDDSHLLGTRVGTSGIGVRVETSDDGRVALLLGAASLGEVNVDAQLVPNAVQTTRTDVALCILIPALGANALAGCTYYGNSSALDVGFSNGSPVVSISAGAGTPGPDGTSLDYGYITSKLSSDLSTVTWSFRTPTSAGAYGDDMAITASGDVIVTVQGNGAMIPITACGLNIPGGTIAKLDGDDGSLLFATGTANGSSPLHVGTVDEDIVAGMYFYYLDQELPVVNGFEPTHQGLGLLVMSTPDACVDLGVTATNLTPLVEEGDALHWRASITNAVAPASDVVIDFSLHSTFAPVTMTSTQGTCTLTPTPRCDLGTLAVDDIVTVDVVGISTGSGAITGSATVSTASAEDQDAANDTASFASFATVRTAPCGAATYFGNCSGDVLSFCEGRGTPSETLQTVDCASEVFRSEQTAPAHSSTRRTVSTAPSSRVSTAPSSTPTRVRRSTATVRSRVAHVFSTTGDLLVQRSRASTPASPKPSTPASVTHSSSIARAPSTWPSIAPRSAARVSTTRRVRLASACPRARLATTARRRSDSAERGTTCLASTETCVDDESLCDASAFPAECTASSTSVRTCEGWSPRRERMCRRALGASVTPVRPCSRVRRETRPASPLSDAFPKVIRAHPTVRRATSQRAFSVGQASRV